MSHAHDVEDLRDQGHVVVEGFLPAAQLRAVREALAPHLEHERFGRNPLATASTRRSWDS